MHICIIKKVVAIFIPCVVVINRRYCSHKIFFVLDSGKDALTCYIVVLT